MSLRPDGRSTVSTFYAAVMYMYTERYPARTVVFCVILYYETRVHVEFWRRGG